MSYSGINQSYFADHSCHQSEMKNRRLKGRRTRKGCARLGGRHRAWPWRTLSPPSSWWKRSSSRRTNKGPQSSNNSSLVSSNNNRQPPRQHHQRQRQHCINPRRRPRQLRYPPSRYSSRLAVSCVFRIAKPLIVEGRKMTATFPFVLRQFIYTLLNCQKVFVVQVSKVVFS